MKTKKKPIALLSTLIGITLVTGWFIRQRLFPPAKAPSRFVQTSHDVNGLRFTPDGSLLLASESSGSGHVTVLDAATAQPIQRWSGNGGRIWLSGDSKRILTIKTDYKNKTTTCSLRDLKTGKPIREWKVAGTVTDVTSDLSLLLSAEYFRDREPQKRTLLTLQEVATGKVRGQTPVSNDFTVRFVNKDRYISVPGASGSSQLIRVSDLKPVLPLPALRSLRTSSDGDRVLGLKDDGSLHLWQLPSQQHSSIKTGLMQGQWLYSLKDGTIIVSGLAKSDGEKYASEVTQVRSADGKQLRYSFAGNVETISGSGNLLAIEVRLKNSTGYNDTTFYDIWDVRTGKRITRLDILSDALGQTLIQRATHQQKLVFDKDERHIAYSQEEGLLRLFDLETNQSFVRGPVSNSGGRVTTDPDIRKQWQQRNQELFAGFNEQLKKDSDQQSFRLEMEVASPDGRKAVKVWNALQRKIENNKPVNHLQGNGLIEVVDTASGRVLQLMDIPQRTRGTGSLGSPIWSKDASKVAMADQWGRVLVWDAATGKQIAQLSGTRPVVSRTSSPFASLLFNEAARLAFHPDGRLLATSREDGSIYLYSLESSLPVAQIGKTSMQLAWMEFAPDGKTLVGTPINSKAMLEWDVPVLN